MGGHYGSIHIRTEDTGAVRAALEELSRAQRTKFLLGPMIDGWVAAFPDENGQNFGVSEALAQKINAPILHCVVFDDDVFTYQFRNRGKLVDSYNSCPDYFGESSESRGGNVDLLEPILPNPAKRDELKRLLDAEEFTFEMERLEKFAALLGLSNAVTAYEYLQDGERDGIRQWKQFVHIPDQSAVRAAKRAAKAKATAAMKQMARDGLLITEIAGPRIPNSIFYNSPIWCIDPSSSDILLAWTGNPISPGSPARVSRINVQSGKETATGIEISGHISCLAIGRSGQQLAVGCAFGDWKTQVWDAVSGKLVTELPQSRAVKEVFFSRDDQTLFSLSEQTITVAEMYENGSIATILLPDAGRTMVLHPGGEYIVAECAGLLAIVHLPARTVVKSIWIPMPPGPNRDLMEYAASQGIGQKFLSAIGGHVPKVEMEATRARMARHFLPRQRVFSLSFGASGNYLFCGTSEGVCALAWDKVMAASDMAEIDPQAFVPAEPRIRENGTQDNQLIYALPVDSVQKRILFAGLEGKVKFANVADERIGDLLSPPVKRPFWQLKLTPDRAALVGTAVVLEPGGKPQPSSFQVWNYRKLCLAAGLEW